MTRAPDPIRRRISRKRIEMGIMPNSYLQQLEFFEAHNVAWTAQAANIGLTTGQMTTLVSMTTAARAAYNAMQVQHENARNSTQQWYDAIAPLREKGADYLKTIKAFAATTNNPSVFTLAVIPPPKTPAAGPPPAIPTDLQAALLPSGAVQISWTGKLSGGVAFSVWRKFNQPADAYVQIATVNGTTAFVDETLPAGASGSAGTGVLYAVRAHRVGQSSALSEPALIRFGSVDGADSQEGLKIAA